MSQTTVWINLDSSGSGNLHIPQSPQLHAYINDCQCNTALSSRCDQTHHHSQRFNFQVQLLNYKKPQYFCLRSPYYSRDREQKEHLERKIFARTSRGSPDDDVSVGDVR